MVLERVARRGRQVRAPQSVDQVVHAKDATAVEREQREQRVPLGPGDVRLTPASDDLERPEQPDLE
jgi:hypothetical protein